ncbi:hypothetical protein GPJ56_006287 [Histomonas meleagridis]|uniref:uncharacterized protein n=1 Tax=Histomonas meleagridis TaxID=135588 RepID=UPI00355A43A8|nr:hypothetical protein GPJ56_006287 [Histomonas meleagridis]KAH0796896.1 hypothetical protein GO595_010789 [Histomonas meleagridis]
MSQSDSTKSNKDIDFIEILSLMASSSSDVKLNAADLFIAFSFTKPEKILDKLDEIQLLTLSLCASPQPSWGTVNTILFGLSNVINLKPKSLRDHLSLFIEMSYEIIRSALTSPSNVECYCPQLNTFMESIINNFSESFDISKEIFLSISEYFTTLNSPTSFSYLVKLLITNFSKIVSIASKKLSPDELSKAASPISCDDKNVVQFYITLFTQLLSKGNNPIIIQILRTHASSIINLSKREGPCQEPAHFLFDIIKSSPKEKKDLIKDAQAISEKALQRLQASSEDANAPVRTSSQLKTVEVLNQTNVQVHKTQVYVLQPKLMSRKWSPKVELNLVEDVGVLFWTKNENEIYKGKAIACSDIENLTLFPDGKTKFDKENVMEIQVGSSKMVYYISFPSYILANQWQVLIQRLKFGK